jgi:hypothetical protein
MYAVQKGSSIYHLLDREPNETRCGLRVTRWQLNSKKPLDQIRTESSDMLVCKHCSRLKETETLFKDQEC